MRAMPMPQPAPASFSGSPQGDSDVQPLRFGTARYAGQASSQPSKPSSGQQQGALGQTEEILARALEEIASAKEEIGKEMKDRLAAYHEFRENLTKEQERVGRLSSTVENAMVEMRTSCTDMRRRNESLREEIKALKGSMLDTLKQTQEDREQKLASIGHALTKVEDATATESQESEVHAAVLRNDLITTLAARVQQEADARSEMTGLAGDVNAALQTEAKERMRRDAALEAAIDETREGLGQMSIKIEEISRGMEKEIVERMQAQGEYQEEFEKQQERLQKLKEELQKAQLVAPPTAASASSRTASASARSPRSANPPIRQYSGQVAGPVSSQPAVSSTVVRYATTPASPRFVPPVSKSAVDAVQVGVPVCPSPRAATGAPSPVTPRGGQRIAVGHTGGAPSSGDLAIQPAA